MYMLNSGTFWNNDTVVNSLGLSSLLNWVFFYIFNTERFVDIVGIS